MKKTRNARWCAGTLLATSVSVVGCTPNDAPPPPNDGPVGTSQQAIFANGNFESGAANVPPPSWTVTPYLNLGVTLTTPQVRSDLQLANGGSAQTYTWTGAQESQVDPTLGAAASLRWPKYGTGVAIVNTPGASNNANSLKQQMTIGVGDVDPADGKTHVRFTVAPVLQNPNHPVEQQPYYFVELRNVTRGTTLYHDFNASAQPGVPWKTVGSTYYTDWQLVDISPGSAALAIGDVVELEVIAAGCSQGGHFGRVYVDGVGSTVPGLFTSATGPSSANAGSNITYTIAYRNGGTGGASATAVSFVTPPNTTYQSVTGATCTAPSVGATGTVNCTLGSVDAGAGGSFQVTVRINPGASGKITNGNYAISATGVSPLIGPKVYTDITSGVSYADLSLSMTNGVAGVAWGQPVSYTIVVSNQGPSAVSGATITDVMPAQLSGATWTCAASTGASCAASGSGSISSTLSLPVGGTATYTLNANVAAGSGTGSLSNMATVTLPAGASDPDPSNNAAADADSIGPLRTLSLAKGGTGHGTVNSVPSAIACNAACASDSATFVDGATVILSASAAPGDTFTGWSGACSGMGTCTLTLDADKTATASFSSPLATNGAACGAGSQCQTGQCVDGVCCNTSCGGGAADCQACNVAGSAGTCSPLPSSTVCRASDGPCDAPEQCDGASSACPADTFVAAGTVCRASTDVCDTAESCTGSSPSCPADELADAGTECRPSKGICDVAESCTGSSPSCPANTLVAAGTLCRASAGDCDVSEACDGSSPVCPTDSFVAAGTQCRASAGVCDLDESCDGSNATCPADQRLAAGTECRSPSCAGGMADPGASCNGVKVDCPPPAPQDCDTYVCGATACLSSCTADADCSATSFCAGGECKPKLANATECKSDSGCTSGQCVDGLCCDSACKGQCEACDIAGHEGACTATSGAPHGDRAACASDGTDCGGACNGTVRTACAFPDTSTSCRSGSCESGEATLPATCDGQGACPSIETQPCGLYQCGASQCLGDCTLDGDCASGNYCSAGICTPTAANGGQCTTNHECGSGRCADGVCCNVACDGQCEACDVAGSEGICAPVNGAPHGNREGCVGDESVCSGTCDGTKTDACSFPTASISCREASCTDGVATETAKCNGAGACPKEETVACAPFLCGEVQCNGDCIADSDCDVGNYCAAGACQPVRTDGAICADGTECASGHCVDGLCCNTSCTGQCEACDVAGGEGTCVPAIGAPHGARAACAGGSSTCGGACDGNDVGACAYPTIVCRNGSCAAGTSILEASCDGSGACPSEEQQACGTFGCAESACKGDCIADADCAVGSFCSAGVCTPTSSIGEACGATGECASGNCVDGVCCDSPCDGQCAACDVAGSVGTCTAVSGDPHGGRAACAGQGLCAGSCDGTNEAQCSFPGVSTQCEDATCAEGVASPASSCDGAGTCMAKNDQSCGDAGCDGTVCAGSSPEPMACSNDADCSSGRHCMNGQCMLLTAVLPEEPAPTPTVVNLTGGCGCSVPAHDESPWQSGALAIVGLAIASRRRRS